MELSIGIFAEYADKLLSKHLSIEIICGVINKFVDKCYNLKTVEGKTKRAQSINKGLLCKLHVKLYAILTSGSTLNEV